MCRYNLIKRINTLVTKCRAGKLKCWYKQFLPPLKTFVQRPASMCKRKSKRNKRKLCSILSSQQSLGSLSFQSQESPALSLSSSSSLDSSFTSISATPTQSQIASMPDLLLTQPDYDSDYAAVMAAIEDVERLSQYMFNGRDVTTDTPEKGHTKDDVLAVISQLKETINRMFP